MCLTLPSPVCQKDPLPPRRDAPGVDHSLGLLSPVRTFSQSMALPCTCHTQAEGPRTVTLLPTTSLRKHSSLPHQHSKGAEASKKISEIPREPAGKFPESQPYPQGKECWPHCLANPRERGPGTNQRQVVHQGLLIPSPGTLRWGLRLSENISNFTEGMNSLGSLTRRVRS